MTRYITKPKPGKKLTPVKNASQPDKSLEEVPSSQHEADKSKPKRGKKPAPVEEEVFEASSFSSDSEPDSLREMNVRTMPRRAKQPAAPVEKDIQSDSLSSSDEPSSLRDLCLTNEDEDAPPSREPAYNRESSIPVPSTRPSGLHSSAAVMPERPSIASKSKSAKMRRSMPASMGRTAPPNRQSTHSRRKSNSPVRRNQQKVYQDIRQLQNGTEMVIPKLPFSRVIREVLQGYSHMDMRVTAECLICLQEASEIYLTQLMEDAWRCTKHRDRVTLTPKDLRLVLMLRNDSMFM